MMETGGYHAAPQRHESRLAGPHPCLPPAGEGEKARGEGSHLSRLCSLPRWGRVRVGATRRGRRSSPPALPPLFPPPLGEGGGHQKRKTLPSPLPSPASGRGSSYQIHSCQRLLYGRWRHISLWELAAIMQRHGCTPQGWLAPIPAFPQRGKERKPEGEEVHLSRLCSLPHWGRVRVEAAKKGRRSPHPSPPASIPSPSGGRSKGRRENESLVLNQSFACPALFAAPDPQSAALAYSIACNGLSGKGLLPRSRPWPISCRARARRGRRRSPTHSH